MECLTTCPTFQYGVDVDSSCSESCTFDINTCEDMCAEGCKTCFSPEEENCLTCIDGWIFLEASNKCVETSSFDEDNNGKLSMEEIYTILTCSTTEDGTENGEGAINPSDDLLSLVWNAANIDDNNKISNQELANYLNLQSELN